MRITNIYLKHFVGIFLCSQFLSFQLNAQSSFIPSTIPGLKLWLTGDSVQLGVSPNVTTCYDLSPASNHAMQGTSGQQPTLIPAGLNGHDLIRFDGADDYLQFNEISDIRTVFWVVKEDVAASNNYRSLFGHTTAYEFTRGDNKVIWFSGFTSSFITSGVTQLNSSPIDGTTTVLPTNFSLLSLVTTGDVKADNFSNDRNSNRLWQGDLAEILVYNQALSPLQVDSVEQYLHTKYAPPVNLGPDTTVCSSPVILRAKKDYFTNYAWTGGSTDDSLVVNTAGTYTLTTTDIFGSVSSDAITISFNGGAYAVNLGSDISICNGQQAVINAGPSHLSYVWSTGSTSNSIVVNAAGTYSVSVTDCLGNISTDNINSTIDLAFTLGNDTIACYNGSNPLVLTPSLVGSYTYLWSNSSAASSISVSASGAYWLQITGSSCTSSDTINVQIDSFPQIATLGPDLTLCSGNSLYLVAGSDSAATYVWSGTNTGTNASLAVSNSGDYRLTTTDMNGCVKTDTITVTINGVASIASFSSTGTNLGSLTQFTDASSPQVNITSRNWSFGDVASGINNSSTSQNPTHVFSSSGTYTVQLTIQNSAGCFSTISQNITITAAPFLVSSLPGLKLWLTGDSVQLGVSPNVTTCYDLSPASNHAMQGTSGQQPTLITAGLNGHDIIRFDGADDYLQFNEISDIRTVFWVVKEDAAASNNYRSLFGHTTAYEFTRGDNKVIWFSGATSSFITSGVIQLNSSPIDGTTTVLPTNFSLLSLVTTGDVKADNFSNDRVSPRVWQGDLAEILVYNQALSPLQVDSVEQYLHTKYAPPVNLGPDTTVCSSPVILRAKKDYFTNYSWTGGSTDDSLVVNIAGTYTLTTTDIFGSVSSDAITISFNGGAYAVNLGSDISICNGQQAVINAGPSHLSYVWSTGSTSNSIVVNAAGTYSVSVTDCLGNISTDIINVTLVSPSFSLGNDTITCYNGNNPLLLSPNVAGTNTYLWSNSSVGTSISVDASGTYWLLVSNSFACFKIDTIIVQVDSFPQIASLGPDVTICTGNSVYLTSGASKALTYTWSDGSTNDSLLITSLVSPKDYSLTATSINGCIKKDTINVTIKGSAPTVAFSISTTCEGAANVFTDASVAPAGNSITSRDWDFGDLSLGSGANPSHTYADSGSYTAKLTITTDVGCTADLSKTFTVYPYPTVSFTSANLCERDSVLFTGSATDYGYPITQWNWNFGEPSSGVNNSSSTQSPKHLYATAATYTVSLTIQNAAGCATAINNSITLKPSPVTDFSTSLLCEKQSISFTDNTPSTITLSGGSWNFGDGSASTVLINPTHTYSVSGTYTVAHVMTYTNSCSNTMTKVLTVNPKPTALYTTGNACVSAPIDFTDTSLISSGSITAWLWTFGAGGPTSTLQNDQHTFNTPVSPQIKLVVTSDQGCKDSITKTIIVRPLPVADFTYSPTNGSPPLAVTFTNTSTGAATYAWDFGDTNTDTQTNTSNTFIDTGSYNVTLIATTSFGCVDTILKIVDALEPNIDVAVQNVTAVLNNNFLTITVQIVNKGTVNVTSLQLTVRLDDGTIIQENWTGLLLKGGVLLDTISTTIYLKDTKHFVCVSAVKPNNQDDENPSDNESCIATDKSSFEVLEPYPVPAGESITLAVLIPNSTSNLEVNICNARGQTLRAIYSGIIAEGLQMFTVNLTDVAKGFYAFTVTYEGKTVVKKFIID